MASSTNFPLLRVATCGGVDDGKSTLIGRLLFDAGLVPDDELARLTRESRGRTQGPEGLDVSLLVDGLEAEREQGVTIDVAWRYFATPRRSFIVADSPGHEQYTRNMANAAANVDAAILLVDARKGIVTQTRRHLAILSLFDVRDVAVVVNKMDLVGWDEGIFRAIAEEVKDFARRLKIPRVTALPVSALDGANVVRPATDGPTLLDWMERVEPERETIEKPFRMAVQWVNRAGPDFRGYSGFVSSGRVRPGDRIVVAGSRKTANVRRIVTFDGDLEQAEAGQSVTLALDDEIDIGRGDVLCEAEAPILSADQFAAHLVWLAEDPAPPGRSYLMRIGTAFAPASITEIKHRLNIDSLEHCAAKTLQLNEVGFCNFAADRPLAFDSYRNDREFGGFILIDRVSQATVAAGTIDFPLRRASNLRWQSFDVDRAARAAMKGQTPAILWMTGLSGAGKSTVANIVERKLSAAGRHVYTLDGDNVRHGLNKDLGFTDADRVENVRRVAEVARLMADAGLIVLASLISPFRRERAMAREIAGSLEFLELFVDTPLDICETRDPKGLYAKARAGLIPNFTGIDSAYEPPETPELRLESGVKTPEELADEVLALMERRGIIPFSR